MLTSQHMQRVGALLAIGWGLAFLLTAADKFTSPSYEIPFLWIDKTGWGALFLGLGLLNLIWCRSAGVWALLVALYSGWAVAQIVGFAIGRNGGPLGWLLWIGLDYLFVHSVWTYARGEHALRR